MSYSTLNKPLLYPSQLKYRIGLAKKRQVSYPLDSMNFTMMDLEAPRMRARHAHHCTYDLTGRMLQFYAVTDGVDGERIPQLTELYERIMNNRNANGTFGYHLSLKGMGDEGYSIGGHFMSGLVEYYRLRGDMRALNAAIEAAEFMLKTQDPYIEAIKNPGGPNSLACWLTEPFAELYKEVRDERYLAFTRRIAFEAMGTLEGSHSHGYMTTLRGILKMGMYAGDEELLALVKERMQEIRESGAILPNGDVSECFHHSDRNEGCSIADWIMLNLLYGHCFDDPKAYGDAEHSLWNALYFNQFVTGGFGHRFFAPRGYKTYIEEAWWCCTPNAGMCMAEVARNVVTMRNGKLYLNFLIPGKYTLTTPDGELCVDVTTSYPIKARTIIKVTGTKENIEIRIPYFLKRATCSRVDNSLGYTIILDGKLGHYKEVRVRGTIMKYGPLVIAPMVYFWDMRPIDERENTVPDGYTHDRMSSHFALDIGEPDADGFYTFKHDPLLEWMVFEEGEMAGISGGEAASAWVPLKFYDGDTGPLFFQPLCSATSNLTLMDVISDFDSIEEIEDIIASKKK